MLVSALGHDPTTCGTHLFFYYENVTTQWYSLLHVADGCIKLAIRHTDLNMKAKRADYRFDTPGIEYPATPSAFEEPREAETVSTPAGAQERFTALADPNNAMAPQAPANEPLAFGCLVVGRDAHVTGVLAVPGTLRVEGRIDGEIDAAEVIVLAGGSIVGELRCDSANIQGTVRGVLRCIEHLDIKGRALVEGDVFYHKGLCVEAGATLNCSMTYQDDSTQVPRTRLPIEPSRPAPHDEGHSDKVSLMSRMFGSTKVSR
jgi:cytoskeletal protein CcmA (bactofilin family)